MSTSAMGAPVVLIGVEWTLVHLRRAGALVEPPDGASEVVLRFSADGQMSGTDGCNFFFGGPVVISGARLSVGRIGTTLMGCPGIVDFTAADGDALTYEHRRSIYPSDKPGRPAPHVLAEGAHGAGHYWLFYTAFDDRVSLEMEYRDAPGERVVMFRPLGGADPVDLPVYPVVDAPDACAYGGFVGDPRRGSDVVAYDANGSRLRPRPTRLIGGYPATRSER